MNTEQKILHQRLHQRFVKFGANAKEWMRKCVLLLPEIEKHRIWEQKKFGSIYEYAAKLAGMSRNTVDDALRILKKIEDKPELQKIVESKGINAVRPVAAIATPDTAAFWAEKAAQMSKHTLEVYVKELSQQPVIDNQLLDSDQHSKLISRTGTESNHEDLNQQAISVFEELNSNAAISKKIVAMELEVEIIEQLQKLKGEGDWNELMKQLLQLRLEKLETDQPQPVQTESRHIPVKIKRYVLAQHNGVCAFPKCKKIVKILHHTQRFALEKVHDPKRLHGLCTEHERIAHHGLIENEQDLPKHWKIKKAPDLNAPQFKIDQLVHKYRSS